MYFKLVLPGTLIPTTIVIVRFSSRIEIPVQLVTSDCGVIHGYFMLFHSCESRYIMVLFLAQLLQCNVCNHFMKMVTFVSYFFSQNPCNFSTTFHIYIYIYLKQKTSNNLRCSNIFLGHPTLY